MVILSEVWEMPNLYHSIYIVIYFPAQLSSIVFRGVAVIFNAMTKSDTVTQLNKQFSVKTTK